VTTLLALFAVRCSTIHRHVDCDKQAMKINLDPDHLAKLRAELSAIELWNTKYYRSTVHDTTDDDSFRARQKRREEILDEILLIVGADPHAFRLSFGPLD